MRGRFCQERRRAGGRRGRLVTGVAGLLAGALLWGQALTLPVYGGEETGSPGETAKRQAELSETQASAETDVSRVQPAGIRLEAVQAENGELKLFVDGSFAGAKVPGAGDFEVMLGNQALPVRSVTRFSDSREGVSYVFLVDVSGSIGRDRMEEMKLFLNYLAEKLTDRDRVSIVTLGNDTYGGEFLTDREAVRERIDGIRILKEDTNLYYGIVQSLRLLESSGAGRRALVVVSDGEDDQTAGITKEEAARAAKETRIPIFTAAMLGKNPGDGEVEQAKILGSFARLSPGGFHTVFGVEAFSPEEGASRVAEAVGGALVLTANLGEYQPGSGQAYLLVRARTEDGAILKDGYQVAEGELQLPAGKPAAEGRTAGAGESGGFREGEKGGAKKRVEENRAEGENEEKGIPGETDESEPIEGQGEGKKRSPWPLIGLAAVILLAAGLYAAFGSRKRAADKERETAEVNGENAAGTAAGKPAGRPDGKGGEGGNGDGTEGNAEDSAKGESGKGAGGSAGGAAGDRAAALPGTPTGEEAGRSAVEEPAGDVAGRSAAEEPAGDAAGNPAAGLSRTVTSGRIGRPAGTEAGEAAWGEGVRKSAKTAGRESAARVYLTKVGLKEGTTYELEIRERAVIGSSPARADYVIEQDPLLSEAQCALTYRDEKLFIAAVDHIRPTLVNGVPIVSPYELCCDDVITIGQADYRVHW